MRKAICHHTDNAYFAGIAVLFLIGSVLPAEEKQQPTGKPGTLNLLKIFNSEFVEITPGTRNFPKSFEMGSAAGPGSERPVHTVTFTGSFSIAKYEVPQNLYEAVMGTNPSRWKGDRNSAETMTWQEAVEFCNKATQLMRSAELIAANQEIRLPSEAEWEYCCRAGTTSAYSFGETAAAEDDRGNKATLLDPFAWHTGNAKGNDPAVGELKPNAWGLYDMHGYLWEYISDAWHENYETAPGDGTSWDGDRTHVRRVMRSGSWRDRYESLRSSTRWSIPDHVRSDAIGFRCVKAPVRP